MQGRLLFTDCSSQTSCKSNKGAAENAIGVSQIVRTGNIAETPGTAPVVKEAAENTRVFQIGRTVKVAETSGAALVVKESAEKAVEASWIVGAASVAEHLEASKVTARIAE